MSKLTAAMLAIFTLATPWTGAAVAGSEAETRSGRRFPDATERLRKARRAPAAEPLPEALRVQPLPATSPNEPPSARTTRPPSRPTQARPVHAGPLRDLIPLARRAGREAAEAAVDRAGIREYYRIGFYEGLHVALDDPRLGRVERLEGLSAGRLDPWARAEGARAGAVDGAERAERAAAEQVSGQFLDLANEPRYAPAPGRAVWSPPALTLDTPTLREIFREFPVAGVPGLHRASRHLAGWSHDPWKLSRTSSYAEFHRTDWQSAGDAFDRWAAQGGRGTVPANLPEDLREDLERAFSAEFAAALAWAFESRLAAAHADGFSDGWSYAAFAREEWQFRVGYDEGCIDAFGGAALAAFARAYDDRYERAYREEFAAWSGSARPRILAVHLRDADDDGIFEPGEELLASLEVANYGGRPGTFLAELDGRLLAGAAGGAIDLPARDVVRADGLLRTAIDAGARAPARGTLELRLADQREAVSLDVSYPLAIDRDHWVVERDNVGGRVRVSLRVVNRSRLPREGVVRVWATSGAAPGSRAELRLDGLERGGPRVFDLAGLDPIDLVAGAVEVGVEVSRAGIVQDRVARTLPDTARALDSPDLARLIRRYAEDRGTTPEQTARLRALLVDRLREDWRVAVLKSGNPYKRDYQTAGTETALGELVRIAAEVTPRAGDAPLLAGLDAEVDELARTLPGLHPLLREWMRRLARRL